MEIQRIKEKNSLHTFKDSTEDSQQDFRTDHKKSKLYKKRGYAYLTYPLITYFINELDYSAFVSSDVATLSEVSDSTFFVERRLRRVFLTSVLRVLAIFSSKSTSSIKAISAASP